MLTHHREGIMRENHIFTNVINYLIVTNWLKMLNLYLYTLIIGHKSCNMLSILNKLTMQKELQKCVPCNVFLDKK